jgi:plastocyanin
MVAQSSVRVTGTVSLRDQEKLKTLKDESQAAVWLEPLGGAGINGVEHSALQASQFRMFQKDKRFVPHLLVVPMGSMVSFPNLDPWFHNVFSLYRGKRFDLGLYQAGSEKSVRFDRPGPSYIFCNIHPAMSAVILVVDSHFIGISDTRGNVSIPDVPPGRYRVHFWYEFMAGPSSTEGREVTVSDANANFGNVTIPVKPVRDTKHSNKYGQEYDPQSLGTEY